MENTDSKITFLSSAISDAQELIRFCDTKTAIVITILGAYLVAFFSSIDKIVENSSNYSCWFWLFLSLFFILLISCIVVTIRIIKPTNNPIDNINFGGQPIPKVKFFLAPNDYSNDCPYQISNSVEFKLKENFKDYSEKLSDAKNDDIISSLTLELFKVSYIRNIKNDRFNTLLWLLIATTILFLTAYLFYNIETHQISEYIKQARHSCCGASN